MNIYDSNIGCQLWISSGKLKKNNMNLFYFFESGGIDGYTVYKWTMHMHLVKQMMFVLLCGASWGLRDVINLPYDYNR